MLTHSLPSGPWTPVVLAASELLPVMQPWPFIKRYFINVKITAFTQQIWMYVWVILDLAISLRMTGKHDIPAITYNS
jgi:hypothetical protein